ncbi:hypothetical protein [Robertmurraya korlensis]|uniref:hypothetical protein n=1 Tax=Robertmurraya korlensis TaxID=519977 RepID=UPI0008251967|nr:hypothetical protein [Robertmurraya korlensis]
MKKRVNNDEGYVIDLCDEILNQKGYRQYRLDFLRGDKGKNNRSVPLPVDVYYKELKLVIEYKEKQHDEKVPFFDKPDTLTISGVDRGAQRKIYDQRRREILPKQGINLLEISYRDFHFDSKKKIIRNKDNDVRILKEKLKKWI